MKITDLYQIIDAHQLSEREVTVDRNQFVSSKGKVDTNIYLITEGSLRVFVAEEFEERNVRFGYKNNIITSLDSYISERPSEFYIQAIKKTTLQVIPKAKMSDFLFQNSQYMRLWIDVLESLVHQQIEREIDLLTQSPKERYNRVLQRSPQLFQQIPHKHIANYLRMTPETLSRLKKS